MHYAIVCTEKCGWIALRSAPPTANLATMDHGLCEICKQKARLACTVLTFPMEAVKEHHRRQGEMYGHML